MNSGVGKSCGYTLILGMLLQSASAAPSKATIALHLSNPTLDDDAGRQSSNTAYFGVLNVGTPGTQFTGCFDTGSADAWLPVSSCESQACQSHTTFSPNTSSTYKGTATSFSIQYATGAVYGSLAYETVNMGGIVIPNQALGMVQKAAKELAWSSCDGIIGFGFRRLSQLDALAPFFSMVQDALLVQNTFSFWFSQDMGVEPAGELVLGGVNPARLSGAVNFMMVPNSTYWSLPLNGAAVGSNSVALAASIAILDTSSTAITLGISDCSAIHQQIPGAVLWANAGLYNISGGCDSIAQQPTVSIKLGGQLYAIPPSLWVIKYQGACVSGFVPVNSPSTQVVLGVPFLRAWHTQYAFDPSTNVAKIGLVSPTATPAPTAGALPANSSIAFAGRRLLSSGNPTQQAIQPQLFEATIPSAKQRGLQ